MQAHPATPIWLDVSVARVVGRPYVCCTQAGVTTEQSTAEPVAVPFFEAFLTERGNFGLPKLPEAKLRGKSINIDLET